MPSGILDALPAIHTTVIGFGAAFFSAFAVYGYQKVREAKDQFDKERKKAESFSTPPTYVLTPPEDLFLKENGDLDWKRKVQRLVWEATVAFSDLDRDETLEAQPRGGVGGPPDADIIRICRRLIIVLHYLFITYPFDGRSDVYRPGLTDLQDRRKQEPFDQERLREMESRIQFLSACWKQGRRSILEVARRCNIAEAAIARANGQQPDSTDLEQVISHFFGKVLVFEAKVLPVLQEELRLVNLYSDRFPIRRWSLWVIGFTAYVLVLGVFLPPLVQSLRSDYGICWPPLLDYVLLAMTFCPYLWLCYWVWRQVAKSSFS